MQVGMSLVRKEEAEKDHGMYAQQLIDLHDQVLTSKHTGLHVDTIALDQST
jgi:hypothetical protein